MPVCTPCFMFQEPVQMPMNGATWYRIHDSERQEIDRWQIPAPCTDFVDDIHTHCTCVYMYAEEYGSVDQI